MFHINPEMRRNGILGRIKEATCPQMYFAVCVEDFLKNRQDAQVSSLADCIVHTLALQQGGSLFLGRSLIIVLDTKYKILSDEEGAIKDPLMPDEYQLQMRFYSPIERKTADIAQGLTELDKWYDVRCVGFVFDKRTDDSKIVTVRRIINSPRDQEDASPAMRYVLGYGH